MVSSSAGRRIALLCCACFLGGVGAAAQTPAGACGAPPVASATAQPNIFSEQQEEWLGEAMAEAVEPDFQMVRDPEQTAYLQRIVDRLAATLPQTHIPFRVQLVDSAEVNGFSIAGGHIYLTRKLAAGATSDDELASVLGHEMGHIASHQFAFETTRDLKRLLGVTSVGDRADVFVKFQQLTEARTKAKAVSTGDSDDKQDEADRIGVYVAAAAGYRPQANPEFWDRMFFTNGRKGGKISDFFGISKPTERRLGRISKLVAALPPGCGGQAPVRDPEFAAWHARVVVNRAVEAGHVDGATELQLTPSIRMDLDRLRFSPDGRYVLAQDESTIFVFSREDRQMVLQTKAPDALPAQFSPDSKRLVFTTQGLHTEMWDIATKSMVEAHEPLAKSPCVQAKISPDGRTVICMAFNDDTREMDLSLLDSATGAVVWKKDRFFQPSFFYLYMLLMSHGDEWAGDMVPSSFSADGNYFMIGPDNRKLAFDLRTRMPVKVGGYLLNEVDGPYAFLGSDRVAGEHLGTPKDSGVFSFPDGKQVRKMPMQFGTMSSVSDISGKGYVITDGLQGFPTALANLEENRFVLGSHTSALDVWDGNLVFENTDGSVILRAVGSKETSADKKLQVPVSDLGPLRTVTISPDETLLALSTRTRGAVWDLRTGKQDLLIPGFTSASWTPENHLFLEFPKRGKQERKVVEVTLATKAGKTAPYSLEKMQMEYGLLREWSPAKNGKQITVRSLADGQQMWTKQFPDGVPGYTASAGGHELLFSSRLEWGSSKAALKANGTLADEAAALHKKENGRLVEAVDVKTGASLGQVVIDLPGEYAGADGLNRVEDLLYVTSNDNRTLVYSMIDGKQVRQMYGTLAASDATSRQVCLHDRQGELKVYDAAGAELAHVTMGKPLRFVTFLHGGKELMLLGADQVVRTVPVSTNVKLNTASAAVTGVDAH